MFCQKDRKRQIFPGTWCDIYVHLDVSYLGSIYPKYEYSLVFVFSTHCAIWNKWTATGWLRTGRVSD